MNDMTPGIGHNAPPDPIDQITAPFDATRGEAEAWLDGSPVENEAQMNAVDALRKDMRKWRLALEGGQKDATKPLHDAYKTELDRWKPTIEDAKRIENGLVSAVDAFKRKLAAEKAEAERRAQAEAWEKTRAAQEAARLANAADIEATRAAAAAMEEAKEAQRLAMAAKNDTVKGLRPVTRYQIEDHRAALNWIATNHRDAITAFIEAFVASNHKKMQIAGVKVWEEKEAF